MDAEVDKGSLGRREANLPTIGLDGSMGGGEADDAGVVRARKKPDAAGKGAEDEAGPPQVKRARKRRIRVIF